MSRDGMLLFFVICHFLYSYFCFSFRLYFQFHSYFNNTTCIIEKQYNIMFLHLYRLSIFFVNFCKI